MVAYFWLGSYGGCFLLKNSNSRGYTHLMPCPTQGALKIVRPSFGAALKYFDAFLGRIVNQEIKEFTAVKWEQIQ
tara:strand:- start:178 stop:402 length:225 start_codon:yes stop_codon:yes gene_type:complete